MDIFSILNLLGGLAIFLYGLTMLGNGLEKVSGGRLEKTLESLTNTVIKSVLLGMLVTAAIQSSSASTVIVVGLVNAKILKLKNAIGVIMGANIGTTITAHVLRLSDITSDNFFMQVLKPSTLAPLACIIGLGLIMAASRSKYKDIGTTLVGFGILFTGLFAMEDAVEPLAELPMFAEAFLAFSQYPLLGVLVGAVVTMIIQSSSASVGILQALTSTGVISFSMAFPIIMGQNIGTTITPVLASIGASKNAKRAAFVHVTFNILGTVIFMAGFYAINAIFPFSFFNDIADRGMIANFHSVFNITVTLLFMPFVRQFEKLAYRVVKDSPKDNETDITTSLDEILFKSPGLALDHTKTAVLEMARLSKYNLEKSTTLFSNYDVKLIERLKENEETVDKFQSRVESYLLKLSEKDLTDIETHKLSKLLHISGEFERIADHAYNIIEAAQKLHNSKLSFSKKAVAELDIFSEVCLEAVSLSVKALDNTDEKAARNIMPLEDVIDVIEEKLREKHMDRLRKGKCTIDAAFPFIEILRNFERIGDICSNISESVISYEGNKGIVDRHEYKKSIITTEEFKDKYLVYMTNYMQKLENI